MSGRSTATDDDSNTRKEWKWMLIDSAIIAAISLFSALPEGAPTWGTVWVAFKAFGLAFALQLAIERGLKREQP